MGPENLMPWFAWGAPRALFVLGLGFLVANLKVGIDLVRYRRQKRGALLTWQGRKPRYYRLNILLGITLGLLLAAKLVRSEADRAFGEAMMFVYYGCVFPLSTRIARGFYDDGIWSDSGFMPWGRISAISWKEEGLITLVVISQVGSVARGLEVPPHLYGEARRVLQDKIRNQDLRIGGAGLDLGSRGGDVV